MSVSTIPRANWPAVLNTNVQSMLVNGVWRYYLPFMFDRSKIVSKPPNFYWQELYASETYFKLYNYVVYGACLKGKNIYLSRCALYNLDEKIHSHILMRILSTTCDRPNRLFYLYDIRAEAFTKVAG